MAWIIFKVIVFLVATAYLLGSVWFLSYGTVWAVWLGVIWVAATLVPQIYLEKPLGILSLVSGILAGCVYVIQQATATDGNTALYFSSVGLVYLAVIAAMATKNISDRRG